MKVICIDNSPSDYMPEAAALLKEGNIYTVIFEGEVDGTNERAYLLKEVQHPDPYAGWRVKRFVPTSGIDETELIKERQEQSIEAALQEVEDIELGRKQPITFD